MTASLRVHTGGKGGWDPIERSRKGTEAKIFQLSDFVPVAEVDNYNLCKLLMTFWRRSKITRKVPTYIFSLYSVSRALVRR